MACRVARGAGLSDDEVARARQNSAELVARVKG
jgi:hypothetical protein